MIVLSATLTSLIDSRICSAVNLWKKTNYEMFFLHRIC